MMVLAWGSANEILYSFVDTIAAVPTAAAELLNVMVAQNFPKRLFTNAQMVVAVRDLVR